MNRTQTIFRAAALQKREQGDAPVLQRWIRDGRFKRRRVPVILQMTAVDCGPACLAMILGYFGRKTSLDEFSGDSVRDGVTAQTLIAAARSFGLRTRAFSMEPEDLAQLTAPVILHWNFNHFVVLERWSREGAKIVDPAWGRRTVTRKEFIESFTGVVLTFEPSAAFERRRNEAVQSSPSYLRILSVPGARLMLAQILVASVILQLFGFITPLATKFVVDRLLPQRMVGQAGMLGFGAIVVALSYAAFAYGRSRLLIELEARLDSHLMRGFFEHLLTLPFRFFQQRSTGDLLMRLGSNAVIREALASYTVSSVLDGTLVLVYLAALMKISLLLGSVVFLLALLEAGILAFVGARVQRLMESDLACQSESQSYLTEVLTGISTLKASGAEEQVVNRWFDLLSRQLNASVQRSRFLAGIDTAMNAIRTFAPLCLLWLGAIQVLEGAMSLGTMLAINALAAAFLMPVNSLVVSAQRIQLAAAHLRRIADVLLAQPEQSPGAPRPAQDLRGAVELRNVSFRYDSQGPLVLKNISLSIRSGQKIALVGRTGSGKSTLARLLLGLYTPAEGEILYDGVPLSEMDLRAVRAQWGVVLQEQFLFSASLRENIALHHPVMPLDQVRSAARMAAIDREIERMPMGYETRIDEGGSCLSGGQRQRLAIARAVSHIPALLLLDEATSQLDVLTEALVHRNLDRLGCTQIVVAHRLSTIRNADVIVVLEEGSIVEQGSHGELIGRNARYAELVCSQMDENLTTMDVV